MEEWERFILHSNAHQLAQGHQIVTQIDPRSDYSIMHIDKVFSFTMKYTDKIKIVQVIVTNADPMAVVLSFHSSE